MRHTAHMNVGDMRRGGLILAAGTVCLLGWMLFVYHIGLESIWVDEWFSWHYSQMNPLELVRATAQDVHPPAYYLLLLFWTRITGSQDLTIMRLTAAFPAVLTVAVTYRLGRDWFKHPAAGLVSAVFAATSGILIYYARELRMYSLIVLLTAVSWWYLWRWLTRGGRSAAVGYTVVTALMIYTYYFSAFVLLAEVIFVAWMHRRKLWRLMRLYVFAGITYLPWLPVVINQIYWERQRSGRSELLGKFGATAPTTLSNIGIFIETYSAKQPGMVLALIVIGILLALRAARKSALRRWLSAAALWCFFTAAFFFVANLWFPIYNLRYPLTIIPGLALLLGAAVTQLNQRRIQLGVGAVILVVGIASHTDAFQPPKAPHRDMLETIAREYQPGDRIWYDMDIGALGSRTIEDVGYHLQFDTPQLSTDWFVWDAPNDYADPTTVRRVWDVRPYWIPIPDSAYDALVDDRTISEEYTFGSYSVRLYEAPPADIAPVQVNVDGTPLLDLLPDALPKPIAVKAGEAFTEKLWWGVLTNPDLDYSYTLLLKRADGSTAFQVDGGLTLMGQRPTSQWTSENTYQLSKISVALPDDLPPGTYEVWMGFYYWQQPIRFLLEATGATSPQTDTGSLILTDHIVVTG